MGYTVLARRYRSTAFGEVVGQEPIAATLRNAIAHGRVAHAYLFCGTRGVGKTSMARLLARALNAPATVEDAPEPVAGDGAPLELPEPEVQQRMADSIMRGEDLNVIEIDGASNNSVDRARELIANASLSPTAQAQFKIYIIDEVHMLSPAAFNALLKTMEEPPDHVKFILCTTEPHKVPATIQSRCQRFDFRNIASPRIVEHLKLVLEREQVEADPAVLWQVARLAGGSMRDALSLMDRLLATGETPITEDVLERMLGLPPQELVVSLVDAFADGDPAAALQRAADLIDRGVAQDQLLEVLTERLRQLMLIATCGPDSDLIELAEDARSQAAEQAQRFDAAGLVYMIAICENLARWGKGSSTPRALLDAGLVRLAMAENMADVAALLEAEQSGRSSGAGGSEARKKKRAGESSTMTSGAQRHGKADRSTVHTPPPSSPRDSSQPSAPSAQASVAGRPPSGSTLHDGDRASESTRLASTAAEPAEPAEPPTGSSADDSATGQAFEDAGITGGAKGRSAPEHSPQDSASGAGDAQTRAAPAPSTSFGDDPQAVQQALRQAIEGKGSMSWIRNLTVASVGDQTVRMRLPERRDLARFVGPNQKQQLGDLLQSLLGRRVRVEFVSSPQPDDPSFEAVTSDRDAASAREGAGESQGGGSSPDRREALSLPLVKQVMQQFEVTLLDVRNAPGEGSRGAVHASRTSSNVLDQDQEQDQEQDQAPGSLLIERAFETSDADASGAGEAMEHEPDEDLEGPDV